MSASPARADSRFRPARVKARRAGLEPSIHFDGCYSVQERVCFMCSSVVGMMTQSW
jgi:hypothetical protein